MVLSYQVDDRGQQVGPFLLRRGGDSGRSPSRSLGEDGQKRASSSDVKGVGSTGAGGFARVADEPPLTRRESAVSCGLIVEST